MQNFTNKYLAVLIVTGLVFVTNHSKADQTLRFKFEPNQPLTYSVESKTKTIMDISGQNQGRSINSLTTTTIEERYKIKLTPLKKNKDGSWTVHYEPLDFNQNKDVFGSKGHVVTSLHGLEVKGTQNGIVIIDTSKGIGELQAKANKLEIYPKMLSGYLDFDPAGKVIKIDGDLPFIDYWTHELKLRIGFFQIMFPDHPVADGGTWTENQTLKDLDGFKLGDNGVVETNSYTLQLIPSSAGKAFVSIDFSVASNWKDMTGAFEQMGQSTTLNISDLNHNDSGKVEFDSARGCLVNSSSQGTVHGSMDMLIQGNSVSMTIDMEENSKFELMPQQP